MRVSRKITRGKPLLALAGLVAAASAAWAAQEWGIEGERKVRVEARVVDLLCEVTGSCVPDCGAGRRQLGLLHDDGRLVPVVKNMDPFAGAVEELIGFCGRRIVADGLLVEGKKMPMFALQFVRLADGGKWRRADRFGKNWARRNGRKDATDWFRHDSRVKRIIARDGVYGIPGLKP